MQIIVSKYKFHKRRNKETIGEVASTPRQELKKKKKKTNKNTVIRSKCLRYQLNGPLPHHNNETV